MIKYKFPLVFTIFIFAIILFSVIIRAQDLGYSNFQGDEVNTVDFLYQMEDGKVIDYLFSQKRGPTQYIINLINVGIFGYHNEFWIRLPYVLFGILAIYTFYRLSKEIFGKNAALLSALFISINGLFIAFSRITQYQSVMYSLIPIGVLLFIIALKKMSVRHMAVAGLLMSVMLITHYDTLSVLPFFLVSFVGKFYRDGNYSRDSLLKYLKLAGIFFLFFIIPPLFFYIPFSMHQEFGNRTSGYLEDRLFGGGFMPRTWLTIYLLSMYKPMWFIGVIYLLAISSALFHLKSAKNFILKQIDDRFVRLGLLSMVILNIVGTMMSLTYFKPRLSTLVVVATSLAICALLTFSKNISVKYASLMCWFLGAYSAYLFLFKDPRTHVYVVFMPAILLAGYTAYKLYSSVNSMRLKYIVLGLLGLVVLYITGLNYSIFVNKNPEYPWFDRYYLGKLVFDMPRVRYKKIDGVFGFNNWRGWEKVAEYVDNGCLIGNIDSNEKDSVTYFYLRKHQLRQDFLSYVPGLADNYIYIEGPHSWEYESRALPNTYDLVATISSSDTPVTYIYSKNYNPECFKTD